jgi:hypothetical protein
MEVAIADVMLARYGTYSGPDAKDPIKWGSGELVEYADVLTTDGQSRRMTLDQSINGDRLPEGTLADVTVTVTPKAEVVYRRDGSERIVNRDKWKLVAMVAAPAATSGGKS